MLLLETNKIGQQIALIFGVFIFLLSCM